MRIAILLIVVSFFMSCQPSTPEAEAPPQVTELPGDFLDFYEKFHADTNFQVEHIAFPLPGKPSPGELDFEVVNFKWTRDGWKMHKRLADDDDTFERKYRFLAPEIIQEFIYAPDYGFSMERRFAKMSDGWNLIYYADMQSKGWELE